MKQGEQVLINELFYLYNHYMVGNGQLEREHALVCGEAYIM